MSEWQIVVSSAVWAVFVLQCAAINVTCTYQFLSAPVTTSIWPSWTCKYKLISICSPYKSRKKQEQLYKCMKEKWKIVSRTNTWKWLHYIYKYIHSTFFAEWKYCWAVVFSPPPSYCFFTSPFKYYYLMLVHLLWWCTFHPCTVNIWASYKRTSHRIWSMVYKEKL